MDLALACANPAPEGMFPGPISLLTSEGCRLVDGEISIPHHRKVQLGVTIVIAFIGVLGERDHMTPQRVTCHSHLRLPGQ